VFIVRIDSGAAVHSADFFLWVGTELLVIESFGEGAMVPRLGQNVASDMTIKCREKGWLGLAEKGPMFYVIGSKKRLLYEGGLEKQRTSRTYLY
jgi:hypothetical protein